MFLQKYIYFLIKAFVVGNQNVHVDLVNFLSTKMLVPGWEKMPITEITATVSEQIYLPLQHVDSYGDVTNGEYFLHLLQIFTHFFFKILARQAIWSPIRLHIQNTELLVMQLIRYYPPEPRRLL